jgi:hypothetical protein
MEQDKDITRIIDCFEVGDLVGFDYLVGGETEVQVAGYYIGRVDNRWISLATTFQRGLHEYRDSWKHKLIKDNFYQLKEDIEHFNTPLVKGTNYVIRNIRNCEIIRKIGEDENE